MSPFLLEVIMINIYKAGGKYKKEDGTEYSIKTINESDKAKYIVSGWVNSLDSIDDIEDAVFEEINPVKEVKSKSKKAS
jgi:hypothetical protein